MYLQLVIISRRWSGKVRGADGGEAVHGGVVPGHGAGHGRLQDQAERHPGPLQGGHQAHVRLVRMRQVLAADGLMGHADVWVMFGLSCLCKAG